MLIISHVCAEFRDAKNNLVFRVKPDMLNTFLEVPDAIQDTLMYKMLVSDGSIKIPPEKKEEKKKLEQEPAAGIAADGKEIKEEKPADEKEEKPADEKEEKPAKPSSKKTKADKNEIAE